LVDLRDVGSFIRIFDGYIHVTQFVGLAVAKNADVGVQARPRWSLSR
jgi:hypothetical protein